jgi:type I restriction enzyme S subunit
MSDEWQTKRLGDIAYLVRENIEPSKAKGLPYIGLEHIGEGSLQLLSYGVAEQAKSTKVFFRRGDILFGKLRPYFRKVIRAPFDGICSTDIWVIRPRKGIDNNFMFYFIASDLFIEPLIRASEGTKMPRANWNYAASLRINVPPSSEQLAIAHILGTLDDKIELNRRMNETLEQMARAIFKSWFVDFEPVRAKMSGRWKKGESLPGLPAHLWDLFSDRLVTSQLGDIPEGWKIGTIKDVLSELVTGARPKGGAILSGVPSIGAENIIGLGHYDYSKEKYIPEEFFKQLESRRANVQNGDVLLYKDGAYIGRKSYFDCSFPHEKCAINEHVFILRTKNRWMQRYLFLWLDLPAITQEIIALNSSSAQPGINQAGVNGLPLLQPLDENCERV